MTVLGSVAGVVVGAIAAENEELGIASWFNWRVALSFPAAGFLKIATTWIFLHNAYLDTQYVEKEEI